MNQIHIHKGKSIHLSLDIPSISFSLYQFQNGIYQEFFHSLIHSFHFTIQQDPCVLFRIFYSIHYLIH